jgi:hypothetical protein
VQKGLFIQDPGAERDMEDGLRRLYGGDEVLKEGRASAT